MKKINIGDLREIRDKTLRGDSAHHLVSWDGSCLDGGYLMYFDEYFLKQNLVRISTNGIDLIHLVDKIEFNVLIDKHRRDIILLAGQRSEEDEYILHFKSVLGVMFPGIDVEDFYVNCVDYMLDEAGVIKNMPNAQSPADNG